MAYKDPKERLKNQRKWLRNNPEKRKAGRQRSRISALLKRNKLRKDAQQFFGDQCSACGKKLKWGMSGINLHCTDGTKHKKNAVLQPELWDKCILLCSSCHNVIHRLAGKTEQQVEDILHLVELLRDGKENISK